MPDISYSWLLWRLGIRSSHFSFYRRLSIGQSVTRLLSIIVSGSGRRCKRIQFGSEHPKTIRAASSTRRMSVGTLNRSCQSNSTRSRGGASLSVIALGGLLVGFGTRPGGGCTSGHGVSGRARSSKRSVAATLVFMAAAAAAVLIAPHVVGA